MLTASILRAAGAALVIAIILLPAQAPAPKAPAASAAKPVGPDEVVATVEGEKITAGRLQQLRSTLPPQFQQAVNRMNNKAFLKSYSELLVLSRLAEQEKLPERGPYKDQLVFLRMNFLAQAYIDNLRTRLQGSRDDLLKFYNEHKGDYEEAAVRAIYVAFSPNAARQPAADPKAKKLLTEEQAKAKAEALAAELKKGADFAKLAKENSDDASTAEKGGDIGPIKKTAAGIPPELRQAIFALKPGEISAPIRQPAGFYIFKLESLRAAPYDEVVSSIATTVQGEKIKAELDRIIASIKVTYDNERFLDEPPPAPPAPATRPAVR